MKHSLSRIKTLADTQNLLNRKSVEGHTIEAALGLVGRALGVDQIRLFKLNAEGSLFELLALWSDAGIQKGYNSTLKVNALEDLESASGSGFAQAIHDDSKLSGMLLIETNKIHEAFIPEDHAEARWL